MLQTRRIPGRLEVDDSGDRLQIESYSARIGREEDPAVRLALKFCDECTAIPGGRPHVTDVGSKGAQKEARRAASSSVQWTAHEARCATSAILRRRGPRC
jgi:hypothetical protein